MIEVLPNKGPGCNCAELEQARGDAEQWSRVAMDKDGAILPELWKRIQVLETERDALMDAAIWMSGSADFSPGGKAREGFERRVLPLLPPVVVRDPLA